MMRGYWLAAPLIWSIVACTAAAQQSAPEQPRSLGERLAQRFGFGGDDDQESDSYRSDRITKARQQSPRASLSGGLPRVSSSGIVPEDYRTSSAPTPPRVAVLPERYQRDSAPATNRSTATASRTDIANTARPVASSPVRRSPFQSPRHEFDAAELRRDLVGTNAPSTGIAARPAGSVDETPATMREGSATTMTTISDRNSTTDNSAATAPAKRATSPSAIKETTPTFVVAQPTKSIEQELPSISPRNDTIEATQLPTASQADLRSLFQNKSDAGSAMPIPGDVLMSQQMPQIVSHVSGPRQIVVGREATYKVWIANRGELSANELATRVKVPIWAEVKSVNVSKGSLDRQNDNGEMRWQIAKLDVQKVETLEVVLVAKESKPIELGVDWTHAPVDSRTVVEVHEPKLQITVAGPEEVLFGKPQMYRLTLSNPGTATAEDLTIHLIPPGTDGTKSSSHPFGSLAAGETKTAQVELTARDAGKLYVRASATAAGGLNATAEKEIFCRKAEIDVDCRGPERKYAGTQATYYLRVRNPGTAPAEGVRLQVNVPTGFTISEVNGKGVTDSSRQMVTWNLNSLQPGDDHYLELKGTVTQAGTNEFVFAAASQDGEVKDSGSMTTEVIAIADLKLQVTDPAGPIAIGEEAVYEICVKNHGANTAERIIVAALFSEGIEPQTAEGAEHSIADGRVAFHAIESISAGEEVTLRIKAKGLSEGTHLFRAEVLCEALEIKLAAEESTRFFADAVSPVQTVDESANSFQPSTGSRY